MQKFQISWACCAMGPSLHIFTSEFLGCCEDEPMIFPAWRMGTDLLQDWKTGRATSAADSAEVKRLRWLGKRGTAVQGRLQLQEAFAAFPELDGKSDSKLSKP